MIPGIVASVRRGEPVPPDVDPHWASVVLLMDASKHSEEVDPSWGAVVLLIDGSKQDVG